MVTNNSRGRGLNFFSGETTADFKEHALQPTNQCQLLAETQPIRDGHSQLSGLCVPANQPYCVSSSHLQVMMNDIIHSLDGWPVLALLAPCSGRLPEQQSPPFVK